MISPRSYFLKKLSLRFGSRLYCIDRPAIMGIINISPDSFYPGSRVPTEKEWLNRAEKMLCDGVDIIDIGAYSSRPGAEDISIEEEIQRLEPAVRSIRKHFPQTILSVDTFRSTVARMMVLDCGADMINDISGGLLDMAMAETVAALQVPFVVMHMRGTPQTMQNDLYYSNFLNDIIHSLSQSINRLLIAGVSDIIIDPGFGFSKSIEQNFFLLRHLHVFHIFEVPLLVGLSRKSMIYKTLQCNATNALQGSMIVEFAALLHKADILRVHDVKETHDVLKLAAAYSHANA